MYVESELSRTELLVPVHSGLKTASDVSVRTEDGPSDNTPFEGRVNIVQWGFDEVCAVVLARFIICLSSMMASSVRLCRSSSLR